MVGTVLSTQSTIESDGLSITNLDLFSLPPPLAATDHVDRVARRRSSSCDHRRVLSLVFLRLPAGRPAPRRAACCPGGCRRGAPSLIGVLDAHRGVPAHVMPTFQEDVDDAGVLADRAVALRRHMRELVRICAMASFAAGLSSRVVGLAERLM